MELALANAFREALENAKDNLVWAGCEQRETVVSLKGPYLSDGGLVSAFYVELSDGKTYTVTVDGR